MNDEGKTQSGLGRSGDNIENKLNQTKDNEKHIDCSLVKAPRFKQVSLSHFFKKFLQEISFKLLTTDFTDVRFVFAVNKYMSEVHKNKFV